MIHDLKTAVLLSVVTAAFLVNLDLPWALATVAAAAGVSLSGST